MVIRYTKQKLNKKKKVFGLHSATFLAEDSFYASKHRYARQNGYYFEQRHWHCIKCKQYTLSWQVIKYKLLFYYRNNRSFNKIIIIWRLRFDLMEIFLATTLLRQNKRYFGSSEHEYFMLHQCSTSQSTFHDFTRQS